MRKNRIPKKTNKKDKLLKIAKLIKESEIGLSAQEGFDTVEDMFADMGINVDNV